MTEASIIRGSNRHPPAWLQAGYGSRALPKVAYLAGSSH